MVLLGTVAVLGATAVLVLWQCWFRGDAGTVVLLGTVAVLGATAVSGAAAVLLSQA